MGKNRTIVGKGFTSQPSFGASAFGGFSTSSGSNLSYLTELSDYSSISDANVIVSFKSIQKKDPNTKQRGLEDLVTYTVAHPHDKDGGVETAILEAWVQVYPRIAIDNARRVRELAHAVQFELMKSARKRMEKQLPRVVGAWLAGTFDRDRAVARAATDGLSSFLTTEDKIVQFWTRCQQQILEYALEALRETSDTLSDTRTTSTDDAEAKYHRVLSNSLSLVLNLLQKLDHSDLDKCADTYNEYFEDDKVWSSVSANDVVVRRLVCQLLTASLKKRPDIIEADTVRLSKFFISEGLKSSQAGSAADFITALTNLSTSHPSIWTSDYRGKKSVISRLRSFLEKGSQISGVQFWQSLSLLLDVLPEGVLPNDLDGAAGILKALRTGISSRDEIRTNALDSWTCYLNTVRLFMKIIVSDNGRLQMVQENVFPLTQSYLYPSPDVVAWSSGSQPLVLVKAYTLATTAGLADLTAATKVEWARLKDIFQQHLRNSLPGASKEHEASQKAISDEGDRWFTLVGNILVAHERTRESQRPIPDLPVQPSLELLRESLGVLETRNWKPFGAAAVLELALKKAPQLFKRSSSEVTEIIGVIRKSFPEDQAALLQTNSAPYIFSSVSLLGDIPERKSDYEELWTSFITAALKHNDNPAALSGLTTLLSTPKVSSLAHAMPELQTELIRESLMAAVGTLDQARQLFDAAIKFDIFSDVAAKRLVKELSSRISTVSGQPAEGVIKALHLIALKKPVLLLEDEETHLAMMGSLLGLAERTAGIREATELRSVLQGGTSHGSSPDSRVLGLVQTHINTIGPDSLAIDTLVQQAVQVLGSAGEVEVESLLPDLAIWKSQLDSLMQNAPDPSLALTSNLGGAYFLAESQPPFEGSRIQRDRDGCSIVGRMALYTAKLFSSGFDWNKLPQLVQVEILALLGVSAELVADQLTVLGKNMVWDSLLPKSVQAEAEDLVSSIRRIIMNVAESARGWREGSGSPESVLMNDTVRHLVATSQTLSISGLYSARLLYEILQFLTEIHGFPSIGSEEWLTSLNILKATQTSVLPTVAVLSNLGEVLEDSKVVNNFCNRLVSDIAGAKLGQDKTLNTLVLLNACMQVFNIGDLPVANNRLVFAVKQIISWLDTPEELDYRYAAEVCRSLQRLLPCIKDVYGSYWEKSIEFCLYLWTKQSSQPLNFRLPELHASLRLMSTLETLDDPNDDLVDYLEVSSKKQSEALIELLKVPREESTQPLEIVDSIICRRIEKIPLDHVKDLSELYGLLASDSRTIQTAAFLLLHKALPAAQETLSMDIILKKTDARLPDELLSLLLEAPTLEAYSDESLAQFPTAIRSYLLAWHVIFDTFEAAAFKLRGDYADNLKQANYIGPLMNFTFDVLGHSAAHALNLEKANFTSDQIRKFDIKVAEWEGEERSMQWLLIHVFYCSLKYVPGLFKAWFTQCTSKQTTIAVQSWLTKYFSPIIIAETLDDVEKWSETQDPPPSDEEELVVKVSRTTRDIAVGYPIDDQEATISIKIPPGFPLENVVVMGINKVAVTEKKWQSWIMTTQGIITFSGGGIIDGIAAFRRNVVGTIKGQSECAICYSFIGSDKRVPDKKCSTCKNLFHRTCLYKWFQSSNQNNCPLCRCPIDYIGANKRQTNRQD